MSSYNNHYENSQELAALAARAKRIGEANHSGISRSNEGASRSELAKPINGEIWRSSEANWRSQSTAKYGARAKALAVANDVAELRHFW